MTTPQFGLENLKVRRGCTVPRLGLHTSKSDGTEKFSITDSFDCCSVLPETQFVGTSLLIDTSRGVSSPLWELRGEARVCQKTVFRGSTPDFSSKLSPDVFFTRGYFCKTVTVWNKFSLLGELQKSVEPHISVCQL